MSRTPLRLAAAGMFVALCLACATGGSSDKPKKGKRDGDAAPKATWFVGGEKATPEQLKGAINDLWGGDPGVICYTGDPKGAVRKVKKAYEGDAALVSTKVDGAVVVVETKSPFGGDETSASRFDACKE